MPVCLGLPLQRGCLWPGGGSAWEKPAEALCIQLEGHAEPRAEEMASAGL